MVGKVASAWLACRVSGGGAWDLWETIFQLQTEAGLWFSLSGHPPI